MSSPFAAYKWLALFKDWHIFAQGFLITISVALLALAVSLLLGIFFGVISVARSRIIKLISRVYVEFIQNTPLVIQIFFLYNGFPYLGIRLPVFVIGVLGVGIYHGAYMAEVIRGGILSIPKGQLEAATSQGFTYPQAMIHIILPQTVKIILPPITNQVVNLVKNTSVLAMIAGGDLMYRADSWSSNSLFYGPAYVVTGILYFLLAFPLAKFARNLEAKLKLQKVVPAENLLKEVEV